jgi:hypothetical protein
MRLRAKTDLRNTDTNRLTSLAYAALYCAEEVFEWLLLDAGHDDEELSRVGPARLLLLTDTKLMAYAFFEGRRKLHHPSHPGFSTRASDSSNAKGQRDTSSGCSYEQHVLGCLCVSCRHFSALVATVKLTGQMDDNDQFHISWTGRMRAGKRRCI